jgi:hypothetical protein
MDVPEGVTLEAAEGMRMERFKARMHDPSWVAVVSARRRSPMMLRVWNSAAKTESTSAPERETGRERDKTTRMDRD